MKEIVFEPGGRNQQIFDTMWRFNQGFWFEDKRPATSPTCVNGFGW